MRKGSTDFARYPGRLLDSFLDRRKLNSRQTHAAPVIEPAVVSDFVCSFFENWFVAPAPADSLLDALRGLPPNCSSIWALCFLPWLPAYLL